MTLFLLTGLKIKVMLNKFKLCQVYGFSLILMSAAISAESVIKLTEFQVKPINSNHPIEPSGLTIKDNELFTVCDDSNKIFKLNLNSDGEAEAVTYINLDASQLSALNFDLEGVTTVDGEFFVVSETHHKLIRVQDKKLNWVPNLGSVYTSAYQAGLFQLYNAGLEAVTYLGDHTFLLSAERQPRGLIEVKFNDDFSQIVSQINQIFDESIQPLEQSRSPDFAGLYFYDGIIYALHRNAYMIQELIKNEQGLYQEGQSWSYEQIVKDPDFTYQDMQFGHAEGLAVDEENFYLVLDNNNIPRLKNPNDKRPLLIIAKRK